MERLKISYSSIVFAIAFVLGLQLLLYSRYIILCSLIGLGIGVLINPILRFAQMKFHLPRFVSALFVFVSIFLFAALILGSVYYVVADQALSLIDRSPYIIKSIQALLGDLFKRYPWIENQVHQYDLTNTIKNSLYTVFRGFQTGVVAVSGAVFALVIGIYTAIDSKQLFEGVIGAFRPEFRIKANDVLINCAEVIRGWFQAQLLDMCIVGGLTGVFFWLAGIEYWAVFGLLTAVLGIIPYIGTFLVVFAASLITVTSDPMKVPWIIGIFIFTQQLEGNVILPLVMKGKAELPVVPLLIFMLLMGNFFGLLGVFLASPLFAVLRTIYIKIYLSYINGRD